MTAIVMMMVVKIMMWIALTEVEFSLPILKTPLSLLKNLARNSKAHITGFDACETGHVVGKGEFPARFFRRLNNLPVYILAWFQQTTGLCSGVY